jgi:hypothetical protein
VVFFDFPVRGTFFAQFSFLAALPLPPRTGLRYVFHDFGKLFRGKRFQSGRFDIAL